MIIVALLLYPSLGLALLGCKTVEFIEERNYDYLYDIVGSVVNW